MKPADIDDSIPQAVSAHPTLITKAGTKCSSNATIAAALVSIAATAAFDIVSVAGGCRAPWIAKHDTVIATTAAVPRAIRASVTAASRAGRAVNCALLLIGRCAAAAMLIALTVVLSTQGVSCCAYAIAGAGGSRWPRPVADSAVWWPHCSCRLRPDLVVMRVTLNEAQYQSHGVVAAHVRHLLAQQVKAPVHSSWKGTCASVALKCYKALYMIPWDDACSAVNIRVCQRAICGMLLWRKKE
jgi:hypothetical protein